MFVLCFSRLFSYLNTELFQFLLTMYLYLPYLLWLMLICRTCSTAPETVRETDYCGSSFHTSTQDHGIY